MDALNQIASTVKTQRPAIWLVGGNSRLRAFLGEFSKVTAFPSLERLLASEPAQGTLCAILPDYDVGQRLVPEPGIDAWYRLLEWKRKGVKCYFESFPVRNYLARAVCNHFSMGLECHFNQDVILVDNKLLQANNLYYIPTVLHENRPRKTLAEGGDFLGVFSPVCEARRRYPVLFNDLEGCVCALMNLHACEPAFMRPFAGWRHLLATLWSDLAEVPKAQVERAFDQAWEMPFALSGGRDCRAALDAAIAWHRRCGLMPKPDGSAGILEMFMSSDFSPRQNYRTDSVLMTAALFTGVGSFSRDEELIRVGRTLADFLLDRGIQDESGFLRWYDHSPVVWSNDTARHGLSLLYLWRVTGDPRYRECADHLAEACLGWLGKSGLYSGCFSLEDGVGGAVSRSPVFYGEMAAFLLCCGSVAAREAVLKFAELVDVSSTERGHSRPDAWSRGALLLYASLHVLGGVDASERIQELLDYYETLQEPCGGFREDDIFARSSVVEAAVASGKGYDRIGDQLYCNNYLFVVLGLLRRGKFHAELSSQIERLYRGVRDYLLAIQLISPDARFDGAWMRAYNMDLKEYHGMAHDADWGPYCLMTGWVMGYIPLMLLEEVGGAPFLLASEPS